jgi:septum site-determining protein MinC
MAPPSSARAPAAFELKSAALTLLSVVLKTTDLSVLATELDAQVADAPGLFDQDPVAIDLSPLRDAPDPIDFPALIELLQARGLRPIAVRAGSVDQMTAAAAAGLVEAPDAAPPRARPVEAPPPALAQEPAEITAVAPSEPLEPPPASATVAVPTMIIDRPLRSGQQVYARGGDLVVLAVVNHGAEVIADGSIHVYAPLRGRAVAGARGDAEARIYSTCMEPQLVSIAGTYRTIETALPADVLGKPAQVRLDGERLVIEPLKS